MQHAKPRCPKGKLAKQACVTDKCTASPFICDACPASECEAAHRYCKTMKWNALTDMLHNYRKCLPVYLVEFMERIQRIYQNLQDKVTRQRQLFREYIQKQILSPEYFKTMHFLKTEQYDSITPKALSSICMALTSAFPKADIPNKLTLNQMRAMDESIAGLLKQIETLYKTKFNVLKTTAALKDKTSASTFTRSQSTSRITSNTDNLYNSQNMTKSALMKAPHHRLTGSTINSGSTFSGTSSILIDRDSCRTGAKVSLDYPKHLNSQILQRATVLNHLMGRKVKEYNLIYRASESKFEISKFYSQMANHFHNREGSHYTLILVKTQHGKVIGGATKLKWEPPHDAQEDDGSEQPATNYKQDSRGGTFMFSADLSERYELQCPQYAIYCGKNSIGFGRKDLRIVNHAQKHCRSYMGFPGSFNNGSWLPIKKSSLALTGSKESSYFKITEWEVFEVVLECRT